MMIRARAAATCTMTLINKWKSVERLALTYIVVGTCMLALGTCKKEEDIAVSVTRRDQDVYFLDVNHSTTSKTCNDDNKFTYLVDEDQCMDNETLYGGKMQLLN